MNTYNNEFDDGIEVNLKELVVMLFHNTITILLVGALCAACAFLYSVLFITPMYQSTTQIYVTNDSGGTKTVGKISIDANDIQTSTYITKDYMIIIKSDPVLEQVISELHLDMSVAEMNEKISVSSPTDTRILNITVQDKNPMLAKKIADMVREVSKSHIKQVMGIEEVNTIEEGNVASIQTSPNKRLIAMAGFLVGVMVCDIVYIVIFIINDEIKTAEDIERKIGIAVMGVLPDEGRGKKLSFKKR